MAGDGVIYIEHTGVVKSEGERGHERFRTRAPTGSRSLCPMSGNRRRRNPLAPMTWAARDHRRAGGPRGHWHDRVFGTHRLSGGSETGMYADLLTSLYAEYECANRRRDA